MRSLPRDLSTFVESGDNVLVLCPPFVADGAEVCTGFWAVESLHQENALFIDFTQSARDRVAFCEQHLDSCPAETAIINVDADTRSNPSFTGSESSEIPPEIEVDQLSSPADLTSLGVKVTAQLDNWNDQTPERSIIACFHSITTLLQYVDLQQAFKFLNVLTGRFTDAGAIAHYHINPAAHDEQTIRKLTTLFDGTVEWEDKEWTVTAQ